MTLSEKLKSHSVRVNNGSGVLVNAMTSEYSYVFTAIHVLNDENVVLDSNGKPLKILNIYRHTDYDSDENFDCAIIQIEYLDNVYQETMNENLLKHNADIALAGYPGVESKTSFPFQQYNGKITQNQSYYLVANLDGAPSASCIQGMSGSGIYYIKDDIPYLVGVEYRMHNTLEDQQYGFIRCRGIAIYQEMIKVNNLAPIMPPFLESFSKLSKDIFHLNVIDPLNIIKLQKKLQEVAQLLIDRQMPKPYELMEMYKGNLLISSENLEDLKRKDLWIAYFEFLIICVLIDDVGEIDANYLKDIERKRRIIYTSSELNWIGQLKEILIKAKKLLDEKGVLIVISPENNADPFPENFHLEKVILDISTAPTEGSFIPIDNPNSFELYKSFKLHHFSPLRKQCIIKKEDCFAKIDEAKLLEFFRDSFHEIIK